MAVMGVSSILNLEAAQSVLTNAVLFVTQVPVPTEINDNTISNVFLGVGAGFGNHLGGTLHAPRGGDLWLRGTNGASTNLTRGLGFGVAGIQHTNGIAVRQPSMHWDGTRALFSMVVGAPRNAADTNIFFWQLHEVTGLPNGPYAISKVPNQPTNYNNISPCYLPDGRIVFTSDRPRDGSPHLYPQLDEYNEYPTVTGLWSLDPVANDLHLLNHTPSGVFTPSVDSFGRLIFVRWDHLVQDRNAAGDRLSLSTNGTFNFSDESAGAAFNLSDRTETFPEPRNFDTTNTAALKVNGNAFNSFFPWAAFLDGSGEEIVNHLGRHDFMPSFKRSFTNDPNLVDFVITTRTNSNFPTNSFPGYVAAYFANRQNFLQNGNYFWMREDPRQPGVYFGVDSPDFGMHAAGQIVTLTAPPTLNPDYCFLSYITPKTNAVLNGYGTYRNPLPMSDGNLVAAFSPNSSSVDANIGTVSLPQSRYNFRLYTLLQSGGLWFTNLPLVTNVVSSTVIQYANGNLVTNTGPFWELDPVEVRSNSIPPLRTNSINAVAQQVFDEEGVDVPLFQRYLRTHNLALLVSHNVTRRDRADTQQPFNLRIAGTTNVTVAPGSDTNKIYDISHIQFLQADQRRGYTGGGSIIQPGRRVLPTPLHEPAADNVADVAGGSGSVKLGDDGSFAALVPARRAMTWQLLGTNTLSATNGVVKERFWVTFQPGEIRTCKNCHGINSADQAGNPEPNNKPQALRDLLQYWRAQNTPAVGLQTNANASYLAVTFKRLPAATNVTHTVEVSTDLVSWVPGSSYQGTNTIPNTALTTEVSHALTNNAETVIVRDKFPIGTVTNRFVRVRVTAP